jgi:hypothetical protein
VGGTGAYSVAFGLGIVGAAASLISGDELGLRDLADFYSSPMVIPQALVEAIVVAMFAVQWSVPAGALGGAVVALVGRKAPDRLPLIGALGAITSWLVVGRVAGIWLFPGNLGFLLLSPLPFCAGAGWLLGRDLTREAVQQPAV